MKFQVGEQVTKYHITSSRGYLGVRIPATVTGIEWGRPALHKKIKLKYELKGKLINRWVPLDLVERPKT